MVICNEAHPVFDIHRLWNTHVLIYGFGKAIINHNKHKCLDLDVARVETQCKACYRCDDENNKVIWLLDFFKRKSFL